MIHIFDMKVSPYTGAAELLLDGQVLSSQSQLRVCAVEHISKWYKDLPDLLYAEVNDEYTLKIQCLEIEYIMITLAFSGIKECHNIIYTSVVRKYDTRTRCQWLCEAAKKIGVVLPEIPKFSIQAMSDAISYKALVLNGLDTFIMSKCTDQNEQVNIILAKANTYHESKKKVLSEDDIIFVIDETSSSIAVESEICLAIKSNEKKVLSLIQEWVDITILYPYMTFCYSKLITLGRNSSFYVRSRLQMLTQEEPVVESKMSTKLECGATEKIALDMFPISIISVKSNNSSVVEVQNNTIKALKTGSAQLEIISETGLTLCTHSIDVYYIPRVQSISLSIVNGNSVLQGANFNVDVKYSPLNSTNVSNAKWSYTPIDALKMVGPGQFEALKPGRCTITLYIDNAAQSIAIQVVPLPKKIKMVSEVRMKLNASPTPFHAKLEPVGAGCRSINVRMLDTSIARWDQPSKSIVAVNEGDTILEVSALDANGNTIVSQSCKITILPEKDIITPPTYPTMIIVCVILAIITATTVMSTIAVICGGIFSVIVVVQNLEQILKKNGTKQNRIECGIGIAGFLVCGLIIWNMLV